MILIHALKTSRTDEFTECSYQDMFLATDSPLMKFTEHTKDQDYLSGFPNDRVGDFHN